MSDTVYFVLCAILALGVLIGLSMLSKVKTAVAGNMISILCTAGAIVITMFKYELLSAIGLWICLGLGLVVGIYWSFTLKMIQMPQVVALLNSFGGAAAALVAIVTLLDVAPLTIFALATGALALVVGTLTFTGSVVAAGKLHKLISQKPIIWKGHQAITTVSLVLTLAAIALMCVPSIPLPASVIFGILISGFFGIAFTVRVGGADMPITISLLVSLSGVADGIAGMAINNILLVSLGGIVGASGLLLTKVMCQAMNRPLSDILMGKTSVSTPAGTDEAKIADTGETSDAGSPEDKPASGKEPAPSDDLAQLLQEAKRVIIVPGYGMALAQAQQKVRALADKLEVGGASVDFAIHPVAGRMPGHMNVLLAEADVPYEKLRSMEEINDDFENCDLAIVIGANDVINPAANTAKDTPIYGMPILNVDKAKNVIICNYDLSPGYAGVDNPLYTKPGVIMMLGNAEETVRELIGKIGASTDSAGQAASGQPDKDAKDTADLGNLLKSAKRVIIVPGYGMALAQAQQKVRALADKLEAGGASVDFAIHPVAGRMPGHMNVLLAEADVPYEKLRSMEEINDDFENCDLAIVIGANDVINPAANTAKDTPIYGMPILNVDKAKNVIICNYDLSPGYAGVDNPLYTKPGVIMMLGNAEETVQELIDKA
jgi:NAD/NADP transhydrogenase beta subunit